MRTAEHNIEPCAWNYSLHIYLGIQQKTRNVLVCRRWFPNTYHLQGWSVLQVYTLDLALRLPNVQVWVTTKLSRAPEPTCPTTAINVTLTSETMHFHDDYSAHGGGYTGLLHLVCKLWKVNRTKSGNKQWVFFLKFQISGREIWMMIF